MNANPDPAAARDPEPQFQASELPEGAGRVEKMVDEEIRRLTPKVRENYVGLIESALAMARIIDNPNALTTHPSAQRQLMVALDKLHNQSVGRQGKLASVAAMTTRVDKPASAAVES
jgi:hypothetical protein